MQYYTFSAEFLDSLTEDVQTKTSMVLKNNICKSKISKKTGWRNSNQKVKVNVKIAKKKMLF